MKIRSQRPKPQFPELTPKKSRHVPKRQPTISRESILDRKREFHRQPEERDTETAPEVVAEIEKVRENIVDDLSNEG